MNGVEILSSEAIYNTILPEWCIALGFFLGVAFMIPAIFPILKYITVALGTLPRIVRKSQMTL